MYSNQFAVSPCEHAMPFVNVGVLSGSVQMHKVWSL
jgi:hypothetical protein